MEKAATLPSVMQLKGGVSGQHDHEIRTPMHAIIGMAGLLPNRLSVEAGRRRDHPPQRWCSEHHQRHPRFLEDGSDWMKLDHVGFDLRRLSRAQWICWPVRPYQA